MSSIEIRTSSDAARGASGGSLSGMRIEPPNWARVSRAMPSSEIQSPRFGVISTSSTTEPSPTTSESFAPIGAAGSSTRMPSWSSPSPSSCAEQIMPFDVTPRIFERLSFVPSGSTVPATATATR